LIDRHYYNGFAEVMKHGLIRDADYYQWLLDNREAICRRKDEVLFKMIRRSLEIKKEIVEQDPHEEGLRSLLNFGHTIGHAIEKASDFHLLHGECVALGMLAEAFISQKRGFLSSDEYHELREIFAHFQLPISVSKLEAQKILEYTKSDKKATGKTVKFALLREIGKAELVSDVSDEEVLTALEEIIH
jgi:3-dehydroquinate synthase